MLNTVWGYIVDQLPRSLAAVVDAHCRGQTAQGHLVRVVAMVAVLAGLVLLLSAQCSDGMTTDAGNASAGTGTGVQQDHVVQTAMDEVGPLAHAEGGSPGSGDMGGVLTTCLAVIALALTAIAGLRPAGLWSGMLLPTVSCGARALTIGPRAPGRAELCVLRT